MARKSPRPASQQRPAGAFEALSRSISAWTSAMRAPTRRTLSGREVENVGRPQWVRSEAPPGYRAKRKVRNRLARQSRRANRK